jgi:mono/diheme cytochrome c family protein
MTMRSLLVVLLLLPLAQQDSTAQAPTAPQGDAERGKALWLKTEHVECRECHGANGQGGFGPDLAGRKLTRAQFIHAVRKPWGIMPAYSESQISDRELIDLMAFFDTLPSVAEPGPWRVPVRTGTPKGLVVATTAGCVQCHHPLFNNGRGIMGGVNADFDWFKSIVYTHEAAYPATRARLREPQFERLAMGSFSPSRLPEPMLQDIWSYITDLGFRPKLRGRLSAGVASAAGVVYTLDVENTGVEGSGLTAEDVTVALSVPAGVTVVGATGAGYQGVRRDEQAKADVAVWTVARVAPGDRQSYTLTLSQAATASGNLRGAIRWTKPTVKTGPIDTEVIPPAPVGARQ